MFYVLEIDFNLSAEGDGECDRGGCTLWFASSGLYSCRKRTPMDDLESLVFSLWFAAGIERDKVALFSDERTPEGQTLAICKKKGTAKSKMIVRYEMKKNNQKFETILFSPRKNVNTSRTNMSRKHSISLLLTRC